MSSPEVMTSAQNPSSNGSESPPALAIRPQGPGHRIDAICSQLSTSVASVAPQQAEQLVIKQEVDGDEGVAKVQPMAASFANAVDIPRASVAGQPQQQQQQPQQQQASASNVYTPVSPAGSTDSKSSTLPGIQEMFSRKTPNAQQPGAPPQMPPLSFPNFNVSALALAAEQGVVKTPADLQSFLLSAAPPAGFNPAISHGPPMVTLNPRPTAQLPPIAQNPISANLRKDQPMQHTAALPGIPALDDVLSYYIGQGKLFKCQYCNILFFERGMFFLHASLHGQTSPWECSICHKICSDKNEFTIHFVNQQHTL